MASGVFDILHLGHVHYFKESKSFGDYLVVVIASDYTAKKHGKELIFNERERSALISELKIVDEVMIGHSDDNIFKTVADEIFYGLEMTDFCLFHKPLHLYRCRMSLPLKYGKHQDHYNM